MQLPKEMIKKIPKDYFDPTKGTLKLLWEDEWRGLGITQVRTIQRDRSRSEQQLSARLIRAWDGSITKYMNQNHIFSFSSKQRTPQ